MKTYFIGNNDKFDESSRNPCSLTSSSLAGVERMHQPASSSEDEPGACRGKISEMFEEAARRFTRAEELCGAGCFDPAIVACRAAVEGAIDATFAALGLDGSDVRSQTARGNASAQEPPRVFLRSKIDFLEANDFIGSDLAEDLHMIRMVGNESANFMGANTLEAATMVIEHTASACESLKSLYAPA